MANPAVASPGWRDALARIAANCIRACSAPVMAFVDALCALVNICAVEATVAVVTQLWHGAVSISACTGEIPEKVDAISVVVTVMPRCGWQICLQAALIDISTKYPIAPVAGHSALARVSKTVLCSNQVGASCECVTEIQTKVAFINVRTLHTVTSITWWAGASESSS